MRRLIILLLAVVFCLTGVSMAGTILLVTDIPAPGVDPGGDHEDDSLVAILEGLGHTVDTSGMGQTYRDGQDPFADPAKVAALESADLVLVSRRANSGDYDENRKNWNELETPVLLMSGYITRGESGSKRWGWTAGDSADASLTETDLNLMGLGVVETLFDWSAAPTPGECPKSVYLPKKDGSSEYPAEAIVIGTFDGYDFLVFIPEGTDFDALNGTTDKYGVAGDRRGFMGHWGYDLDTDEYGFDSFITDAYVEVLAEMVNFVIPEPATIALLGLGGLALLRVRKRS